MSHNLCILFLFSYRLESLNEKRSGVVQMVKLAEKDRDSLEVCMCFCEFVLHVCKCSTKLSMYSDGTGCEE